MKVFVITRAYDYEGESPVDVAASCELAMRIAEKDAASSGYEGGAWKDILGSPKLDFGSVQWIIREWIVREEL